MLALFAVSISIYALEQGRPALVLGVIGYGLGAAIMARAAVSGILLEAQGIKARKAWRTYRWRWDEVDHFELRGRRERPRFRVHLHDGQFHGFLGFFARSPAEEERGQALFKALEERLEAEHDKRSMGRSD